MTNAITYQTKNIGQRQDIETLVEDYDYGCFELPAMTTIRPARHGYNSNWHNVAERDDLIVEARGMTQGERITYRGHSTMYRIAAK